MRYNGLIISPVTYRDGNQSHGSPGRDLVAVANMTVSLASNYLGATLLHSPGLVAIGLSVDCVTWPPIGWCCRLCDWLIQTYRWLSANLQ